MRPEFWMPVSHEWSCEPARVSQPAPGVATPTPSTMVRVTWSQFEANPNPMLAGYGLGSRVPHERQFTTHEAAAAFCEGLRCSPGINNIRINGTPS